MTAADGGFRADPAGMAAVAARLDDVATAVDAARPTAGQVSGDAFGLVGGLFAGAATSAVHTGAEAVSALAASLLRTAGELRHAARDYELTDAGAALAFAGVGVPAVPAGER
ncbi:hypothetical protein Ae168Ps1_3274c [Pseudonocardia sp. Ae168_Ps1]|uniref:type VII secretion target n=1 Tax=unclassified Pseudonocardia TaxID=2619320 RepID=UPI00094AE3B8|nr:MULTISPECIES: type VII secretion target [unclassified Pseudonocardia]OLL74876.1 hypothetical protein Ae150APs1_3254c [Pseudonocardia sp. Ae150A_Ps1]OLL80868.1 hypothetical protein Ae168Ps1_3274c [Pseudonocardia sp. Ae168_Ps1]OLL85014.1 hypothetical protein Ae263Ps1_2069 [Pseudonocardia sp. Ae263_Ps1]OLL94969.1 hypothetical protein Ae356Ps1_4866c [Pseudonocardia sp. Ae356_Ps1]